MLSVAVQAQGSSSNALDLSLIPTLISSMILSFVAPFWSICFSLLTCFMAPKQNQATNSSSNSSVGNSSSEGNRRQRRTAQQEDRRAGQRPTTERFTATLGPLGQMGALTDPRKLFAFELYFQSITMVQLIVSTNMFVWSIRASRDQLTGAPTRSVIWRATTSQSSGLFMVSEIPK